MRFENVGLSYGPGPEVLRDVTFELPAGSFHYVTGRSGAGKSSLLSLACLAQRPTRGRIEILDTEVSALRRRQLPALRRRIGVVFQDCRLIDHLSVFDNAALPLRLARVAEDELRAHVLDLLSWVGLAGRHDARPTMLSGGERQRLAIARAAVARPQLLLADEPTGNVDDETAFRLLLLFDELNRRGATVLIATHSAALVRRFPHAELRLADGRIALAPPGAPP